MSPDEATLAQLMTLSQRGDRKAYTNLRCG